MHGPHLDDARLEAVRAACDLVPTSLSLLAARHDDTRTGILVTGVQQCAGEPILLSVPVRRGHRIEPIIRDSRAFSVCSLDPQDRAMRRRFEIHFSAEEAHDPFDALPVVTLQTGAPVLRASPLAFDCEVVRHIDMDADHELYIGRVVGARIHGDPPSPTRPSVIGPLHVDD